MFNKEGFVHLDSKDRRWGDAADCRMIHVKACLGGSLWSFSGVYGPRVGNPEREGFWKDLNAFVEDAHDETECILGDFNALGSSEEAIGIASVHSLIRPEFEKWCSRGWFSDLWKWHGKNESVESMTRMKNDSEGSRIDRILLAKRLAVSLKTSSVRTWDWKGADDKVLTWTWGTLKGDDWSRVVANDLRQLHMSKWTESTTAKWQAFLQTLQTEIGPFREDPALVEKAFRLMRAKLYSLVGAGTVVSAKEKRRREAIRKKKWMEAERLKQEMAADKQRRISGKKKGAGHREIFALFEKGHWVVEDELDRLVSEKMRSFGHQSPAHCEWGQGASTVPPHLKSSFEPPSFHEFVQALRKVRKRRAVCENDIPAYAILQGNEWLQHFCFDVIVWVWNRPDKAPKRWWGDNIRFIPKERGDQSQLQGWRPIAVGGTIYGILMRLWAARLRKVAEQCNWLADEQCGFRPRRSARGAAALLRSRWYQLEGNGCIVQGDIEKAFPSISPANLSKLLADRGVPMHFLALLDAVYTGVRVDGFVSGKLRGASGHCSWETQGLRQGCPASPLLMAIWINQAFSELKEKGFSVVGYADGVCIHKS